jgi:hypothetical protein
MKVSYLAAPQYKDEHNSSRSSLFNRELCSSLGREEQIHFLSLAYRARDLFSFPNGPVGLDMLMTAVDGRGNEGLCHVVPSL